MFIKWKIEKKRGNLRPSLTYSIELEEFEQNIAIPIVTIESEIPVIPDDYQNYCLPGTNEREEGWDPTKTHKLSTPYFKDGSIKEFIRLPFRDNNDYPEVHRSFEKLRNEFEKHLKASYDSKPISKEYRLELSEETKKIVASGITAAKMLKFAGVAVS